MEKIGAPADTADLELYDYQTDPLETKNLAPPNLKSSLNSAQCSPATPKPAPLSVSLKCGSRLIFGAPRLHFRCHHKSVSILHLPRCPAAGDLR